MKHRYSRAFALPVVMISSVVMMMVLLSGLTAASSVNVGLRAQYEDKMMQSAAASGIAMAKNCIARNDNTITWSNTTPLKPNTNCKGVEQFSCPSTSTEPGCYLVKSDNYRSKFTVGVTTSSSGGSDIDSQAILYQIRQTSGTVLKQMTQKKKAVANGSVSVTSGLSGIVAGAFHACGVDISGKAYCWGNNTNGQLGNGTTTQSGTPVAVLQGAIPNGVTVVSLAAGGYHTCAVASNGKMYCWGNNTNGQLGNTNLSNTPTPVAVLQGAIPPTDVNVRSISAGMTHTCIVASNGKAYCWGYNTNGQLGNGNTTQSSTPVAVLQGAVPTNSNLVGVGVGQFHTCALSEDGKAYCWGNNTNGQLGNGLTAQSNTPVAVSLGGIPNGVVLRDLSVGANSSCVLGFNNKAYCWGGNAQGQLGNGNTTQSSTPVAVLQGVMPPAPAGVIQDIAVGYYHACARMSNNKAYCWGYNAQGQLGNGLTAQSNTPVAVSLGSNQLRSLAAGSGFTCGVRPDAKAMCWGEGVSGQLGNGTAGGSSSTPVSVSGGNSEMPLGIRALDIDGTDAACAISAEERLYCWGNNGVGQFGNNNTANSNIPVASFTGIAGGADISVKSISVGGRTVCATLSRDGDARCSGYNNYGQLGNGTTNNSSVPVAVAQGARPLGVELVKIKTNNYTTCAVGSDGKAYCWGYNNYGQLGNGTTNNSSVPVAVAQGAIPLGVTAKSVKGNCMFGSDSKVYCWGYNYSGQLGNGTTNNSSSPVAVLQTLPAGVTVKSMSAGGGDHRCVVGSDGKAYCWGDNSYYQLGIGYSGQLSQPSPFPVTAFGFIPTGVSITSITAGQTSTCAVASNSRVYCWGYNGSGQLGTGTIDDEGYPAAMQQRLTFRGSGSRIGSGNNASSLLFTY